MPVYLRCGTMAREVNIFVSLSPGLVNVEYQSIHVFPNINVKDAPLVLCCVFSSSLLR